MAKITENFWEFGDLLKTHLPPNMYQAELAALLDIHRSVVGRWLNDGGRPANPDVVIQISEILELNEVDTEALLIAAGYTATAEYLKKAREKRPPALPSTPSDDHEVFFLRLPKKYRGEFRTFVKQRNLVALDSAFNSITIVLIVVIALALLSPIMVETARHVWNRLRDLSHNPTPTPIITPTPEPTATGSFTPTVTVLPTVDTLEATPVAIPSTGINIRRGPGTEYEIIQTSNSGERLPLIGKNPVGTWWNVLVNGASGWVSGEHVSVQNADTVPVVDNYPPPPSTVAPVPTPVTATPPLPTATPAPSPTNASSQQNPGGTSETRELASFSQIILSAPGNLLLVQEASSSITIDAPENVRSVISTRVEGNTLFIDTNSSSQITNASIQYRLSTPSIDAITVSDMASIHANNVKADSLNLISNGTGTIDIEALAARAIGANINGTGRITISSGEVVEQNVVVNNTGNFSAGNLNADKAIVQVIGSGKAIVWVNSQLGASVIGTGTIEYYGLPPIVSRTAVGLGKIQPLGAK